MLETPSDTPAARLTLTPAERLLLLLARVTLDQHQLDRVRDLSAQISDWPAFANTASVHFVAPLCLHHLAAIEDLPDQAQARAALQTVARPMLLKTLALAATQQDFMTQVIAPLQIPMIAFKGRGLAARYYPDPNLRFCRDIDVLLPVSAIPAAITRACRSGFRTGSNDHTPGVNQFNVVARSERTVKLFDERQSLIEVHSHLDKSGFLFDEAGWFARAESRPVDGQTTLLPATTDHFLFICLHHSRHQWSRLIWLADLDALLRAADFDLEEIRSRARECGLEATVEACLDFHAACAAEEPLDALETGSPGRDLLERCLTLIKDPEKEFVLRPQRASMDFHFDWQIPAGFRRRLRWQRLKTVFRPNITDFHTLALPQRLYWLYYPLRPLLYLLRRTGLRRTEEPGA